MSYKQHSPIPVTEGGTGDLTLTVHGVLIGETTSSIATTAAGTTGQVLTGVTGSDPVWASPSGGSITITGDTGGALSGSAFTFTGSTTGLSFGGSGTTETLSGTLIVGNGGTGATTLTGVLIGHGTSAVTGNAVTNHNVLVGGTSNAITSVAPSATSGIPLVSGGSSADPSFTTAVVAGGGTGAVTFTSHGVLLGNTTSAITATAAGTTGQVLTGVTGSAPTFQSPAGIITLNGDSGSATGSTVTIRANNAGLACGSTVLFSGSSTTMTMQVTDANDSTLIGNLCGNSGITGIFNTGIGYNVLTSLTTGSSNIAIGAGTIAALKQLLTGSYNIALGADAGWAYTGSESSNINIGQGTQGTIGESNVLRIGSGTGTGSPGNLNSAYICGIKGITVTGSAVLVSSSNQLGITVSSSKFKENIEDMGSLSSNLLKLRPVSFNYTVGEDRSQQTGLIAEEVNEVMPSLVVYDKSGDPQTVKYHDLPALLLNELQKAVKRIEVLESKLEGK